MSKTIIEKLNLTQYSSRVVLNRPNKTYLEELSPFSEELLEKPVTLIFAFVTSLGEFRKIVQRITSSNYLMENGLLYIAYPKKGNSVYPTFVHRDEIFPTLSVNEETGYIQNTNFKFNRMVRLDDVFTVVGIKNTPPKQKKERIIDYKHYIPEVLHLLQPFPEAKAFYQSLTIGYQKEWARFIFSAKQAKTQEKRKQETILSLKNQYKTYQLYQQSLKK